MEYNYKREKEVCNGYKRRTGKNLSLRNVRTINEKTQGLKVYDSTPLKGVLADKYESRAYLKNLLKEDLSVPLLGVGDRFEDIDFEQLPDRFVLKATHGSGGNVIVRDKQKLNLKETKAKFDKGLSTRFGDISCEYHYNYIKPRIIAEEFLEDPQHANLIDYRIYCYNGDPKEVGVDANSGTSSHLRNIYDINFNKKNVRCIYKECDFEVKKPFNYEKMVDVASQIGQLFAFVRVDFFEIEGRLYLGELTFTPMAGLGTYKPPEYGLECGNMLDLSPLMR